VSSSDAGRKLPSLMPKRLLASFSFFTAVALASAAPLFNEPVPELHLTNGEVLHDVVAKAFNETSVLVRYSEGGRTVAYDLFPAEYKSLVLARKPVFHVSNAPKPKLEAVKADPKKAKAPASTAADPDTINGLTLKSFSAGGGTGYMQTEIFNDNDQLAKVMPFAFQATLDNGEAVVGRHFVETDDKGNIHSTLKGVQQIDPHATTTLKVSFPVPPGVNVTKVTWNQS
jgi:hypothetical protein